MKLTEKQMKNQKCNTFNCNNDATDMVYNVEYSDQYGEYCRNCANEVRFMDNILVISLSKEVA